VLAERFGVPPPFYLGAAAVLLAAGVLATGHRLLARADEALAAAEAAHAAESDLDAAELEEVAEDGTGEAGARLRAEVPPPTR
jgi:ACDE family multidrug resistance protein